MKEELVEKEYQRLLQLVKDVSDVKKQLLDELLRKAAFLKVKMDSLQKDMSNGGTLQKSNKGNVRISQRYKVYLTSLSTYEHVLKTINSIVGKTDNDEDDEFDKFMKEVNGGK